MKPLDIVQKYLASFYGEAPLEEMRPFLADDLSFKGPFNEFDSANAYFAALTSDPPQYATYRIIEVFQKNNSVCLIYQFSKPGVETTMVQIFEIRRDKISRIRLIFNPAVFD